MKFADECLRRAAEDIRKRQNDPELIAAVEREMIEIRLKSSAALERLDRGYRVSYNQMVKRNGGVEPRYLG